MHGQPVEPVLYWRLKEHQKRKGELDCGQDLKCWAEEIVLFSTCHVASRPTGHGPSADSRTAEEEKRTENPQVPSQELQHEHNFTSTE
ncbi:unnamed protein product, partial [Amoebophrya sp. A120]|eukprot:GSA120T00020784001.1